MRAGVGNFQCKDSKPAQQCRLSRKILFLNVDNLLPLENINKEAHKTLEKKNLPLGKMLGSKTQKPRRPWVMSCLWEQESMKTSNTSSLYNRLRIEKQRDVIFLTCIKLQHHLYSWLDDGIKGSLALIIFNHLDQIDIRSSLSFHRHKSLTL